MTKRFFVTVLGTVAMLAGDGMGQRKVNPVFAPVEDAEGLPRVLLIGDSISIGYTLGVRKLLEGKANVHRPPANCASTIEGKANLERWLGEGKWDVIHFNWGLHDLKYLGPNGGNLADPKLETSKQKVEIGDYEKSLGELVERLEKTGATLIWRNTTPVPQGVRGRVPGDAVKYNAAAAKVMVEKGVETHDLFTYAKKREAEIQRKADVHYTKEGSAALAAEVAKVIEAALK